MKITCSARSERVSAQVWLDPGQRTPSFPWDLALPRGTWRTLTFTLSNGAARLFDNGVEVAHLDGMAAGPREFGSGFKGKMRRLTVWNRALTAPEVSAVQHGRR